MGGLMFDSDPLGEGSRINKIVYISVRSQFASLGFRQFCKLEKISPDERTFSKNNFPTQTSEMTGPMGLRLLRFIK